MRFAGGQLKYAKIDTAAGSTVTGVAAVAGSITRVYAIVFTLASGTIKFQTGSTDFTGAMTLTSFQLMPMRLSDAEWQPHFVCVAGDAFNLAFSASAQCSGYILYTQEPTGT